MEKQYMEYISLLWLAGTSIGIAKDMFYYEFGFMSLDINKRLERYYSVCDSMMELERTWKGKV